MNSPRSKYDVLVVGGGIVGCYVAYYLRQRNPAIDIAVIEPVPDAVLRN